MLENYITLHRSEIFTLLRVLLLLLILVCFWWEHIQSFLQSLTLSKNYETHTSRKDLSANEDHSEFSIKQEPNSLVVVGGDNIYNLQEAINKTLSNCFQYLNAPNEDQYEKPENIIRNRANKAKEILKTRGRFKTSDSKNTLKTKNRIEQCYKREFPTKNYFSDEDIDLVTTNINVGKYDTLWELT